MRGSSCQIVQYNQFDHPLKKHEKLVNANKQWKKAAANATAAAPVGGPIEQALQKTKKLHKDHLKQKALTMAITKMISVDDQPFSVVKDGGFSEVLEVAEPRYDKPRCLPD